MQTTKSVRPEDVQRSWYVVDLADVVLGRAASQIATILRGKHKPTFTPHVDTGDYVIVVNAAKVRLTGNKEEDKVYYHHTGYIGGIKSSTAREIRERNPVRLVEDAVRRMLRRSPLGRQMMKKLKVYPGAEHPHVAQQPQAYKLPY